MKRLVKTLLLLAVPSAANARARVSNVSGFEISEFAFMIAAALVLTLLFRRPLYALAQFVAGRYDEMQLLRSIRTNAHRFARYPIIDNALGGLTRIDLAVLAGGGIFCIRHIPGGGDIQGKIDEPQWRRTLNGETCTFLNPVLQNEGRVRSLRKLLPAVPIRGLVVFSDRTRLRDYDSSSDCVVTMEKLGAEIASYEFPKCDIENWDDVWLNFNAAIHDDEIAVKDYAAQINFS